jgi:hypothetical protein
VDSPRPETDADRKLLEDIASHGWHVIRVPERGVTPGWAFTIGLYRSFQHPELVIFGLPLEVMHRILNQLGDDVAKGLEFSAHSESDRVLENYTCAFRPVASPWLRPFLGYALWFYSNEAFPALQCLWPDRAGHLPDDPAFDPDLKSLQPLLEHSRADQARTTALLHSLDP